MNSTVKTSGRFSKSRGLRASVPSFSLPHPSPSTCLLSPRFSCSPNANKLLRAAPISFAWYGNACYAGYCSEKAASKTGPTIYSLRLVNAESFDWRLKYLTSKNENILMTLFSIIARSSCKDIQYKKARAAAYNSSPADTGDIANVLLRLLLAEF